MKRKIKKMSKAFLFVLFIALNMKNISSHSSKRKEMESLYFKIKREAELKEFNQQLKENKPYLFVLAMRESALEDSVPDYTAYNEYGYIGAWQINISYLPALGIYGVVLEEFIKNPDEVFPFELQLLAVERLIEENIESLGWYFDYYPGKRARGINITEEGMIYAAHLGGSFGLKKFLRYGINPKDAYGTSIKDYLNYKNTFKYQL